MSSYREDEKTNDYSSNDSSESESEQEEEYGDIQCKNLDPALAKLMGILIEEQKEIDWKPPLKSGLDNSKEIVSSMYLKHNFLSNEIDYFTVIKDDILSYKTLTKQQIEYIKHLNNEDKFEVIQIYNKLIDITMQNMK
jgi:hypothetical protein